MKKNFSISSTKIKISLMMFIYFVLVIKLNLLIHCNGLPIHRNKRSLSLHYALNHYLYNNQCNYQELLV